MSFCSTRQRNFHRPHVRVLCWFLCVASASLFAENTSAPNAFDQLELKGITKIDDEWRFSIKNTTSDQVVWLKLSETKGGVTPTAYDSDNQVLTIRLGSGETLYQLPLSRADSKPMAVVTSKTVPDEPETETSSSSTAPRFTPPPPPNRGLPPSQPAPKNPPPIPVGLKKMQPK